MHSFDYMIKFIKQNLENLTYNNFWREKIHREIEICIHFLIIKVVLV